MEIREWEFSLAKAEYLLNYTTTTGEGGDKRKFWHDILGFQSPEAVQTAILEQVKRDRLELSGQNVYGVLYRLAIELVAPFESVYRIRTIWIVRFGEDIARFVTAYPEQRKE